MSQNRENQKPNTRVVIFDWIRLLATIWVVIGHSAYLDDAQTYGSVSFALPELLSPSYNDLPLRLVRFLSGWVYTFHMPLFFLLSGAVLTLSVSLPSFDDFVRKKAKRLLLPYLFWGYLFMLPVKYLIGYYTKETFAKALAGFFVGEDAGHLWFLPALFWSLLIYVAIRKVLAHFSVKSELLPLVICMLLSFSYELCPFEFFGFKTGLDYLIWVALGYLFETIRQKAKPLPLWKLSALLVVMMILEVLHRKYLILHYLAAILVGCALTYLLARLCEMAFGRVTKTGFWRLLCRNLFAVYLIHDPLEFVILRLFWHFGWMQQGIGVYAYTVLRTVGVFAVCVLAGELVRIVCNRLGKTAVL